MARRTSDAMSFPNTESDVSRDAEVLFDGDWLDARLEDLEGLFAPALHTFMFGMLHCCPPCSSVVSNCFALSSSMQATDNLVQHPLLAAGNKDGLSSAVTDSYIVLEG